ncbi:ubiquinone/menaquinone biosynthesis methyltransferase [Halorhodospira neutriphila]|uniref:Ubiquinone/menaquinone biosynthesis C-methyltransferase UbiE n=1 Tax=Halorhodospira neutriphila TaxID=168379 RepID=A0ABS1E363_9GAMM|nr:bifunctional demethylmenaquinone methyltransferase/2-methoxy-6-polyprenyl-1,4-benzoquinol methylase [Halorhodospira neutriphila]
MSEQETTHFGYRQVPVEEKARHVGSVFDSVADRYDLMNDLMSAGLHRLWKRQAIRHTLLRPGHRVLDLAAGTGDLASLALERVGPEGEVVLGDINGPMLARGRDRLIDQGVGPQAAYVRCDAEALPFPDAAFDRVTIGFGLRNVTHKEAALAEMRRILRPGGRAMILEFSQVRAPGLRPLYDFYSFRVMPLMGRLVTHDAESYRYLAESIRVHPDAPTLAGIMEQAGLEDCEYTLLTGGVVAIHTGWVY